MSETRTLRRRLGIANETVRIKKERVEEVEQEYEEEHRTFTTFSQKLEEKWEQRFNALAVLARSAGVLNEDVEAARTQAWQSSTVEQCRVLKWSESSALHWLQPQLVHLRFAVGSRVMVATPVCIPGSESDSDARRGRFRAGEYVWKRGIVECHLHRDDSFPADRWAAYRVRLETPYKTLTHIYVPVDSDQCIQLPEADDEQVRAMIDGNRAEAAAAADDDDDDDERPCDLPWSQLSAEQQRLAALLTFDRETWGDNPVEGELQGFQEDWSGVPWTWSELEKWEELGEELDAAESLGFDAGSWKVYDEDDPLTFEPWSHEIDAAIEADDPRRLAKVVAKYVRRGHHEGDIYENEFSQSHLLHEAAQAGAARIVEHLIGCHGLKTDGSRACMMDANGFCCSRGGDFQHRGGSNALRACPSLRAYEGDSPLHQATGFMQLRIMSTLIRCGANIDHHNRWGLTPLGLALFRFCSSRGQAPSSPLSLADLALAPIRLLLSRGASLQCSCINSIYDQPVRAHICDLHPWRNELHPTLQAFLRKPPNQLRGITVCPDLAARHAWLLIWASAVRKASPTSTERGRNHRPGATSSECANPLGLFSRELMRVVGLKLTRDFRGMPYDP